MPAETSASTALINTATSEAPTAGLQIDIARIRSKKTQELAGMYWYGQYAESEAFHYLARNELLDSFNIEVRQVTISTTEWEHRDIDRAVAAVKANGRYPLVTKQA